MCWMNVQVCMVRSVTCHLCSSTPCLSSQPPALACSLSQVCAMQPGAMQPLCRAFTALPLHAPQGAALHQLATPPPNPSSPPNPQPHAHTHRAAGTKPPVLLLPPTRSVWRSCMQPILLILLGSPAPARVSALAGEALATLQPL